MPDRNAMIKLVNAHLALDDEPMKGALWIRQDEVEAWLIEVLPDFPDDSTIWEPVVFSPSANFKYPLFLVAGNIESLCDTLADYPKMAEHIVSGEVLQDSSEIERLRKTAQDILSRSPQNIPTPVNDGENFHLPPDASQANHEA